MTKRQLYRTGALLLTAYTLLLTASLVYGRNYADILIPLYRWELGWLAPEYRVRSIEVTARESEAKIAWFIETIRAQWVGSRLLPQGTRMQSSTLLAHALQHPVLIYTVLLVWPVAGLRRRLALLVLGVPFLLVVEVLDIPFVLLGAIEDVVLYNMAPEKLSTSGVVYWMNFLNSGGRLALSIAAAFLAVSSLHAIDRFTHDRSLCHT